MEVACESADCFRARDRQALARRYRNHLAVAMVPANYEDLRWQQRAGATLFAPFEQSTA
jgi:hypothetical protein